MQLRLVVFFLMATAAWAQTNTVIPKPARPFRAVEHVLIICIDGLRPDRALLADMPTLRGMLREGAYTFWARTTAVSITLPSVTSMLTGVIPQKHGIQWNEDLPINPPVYPKVPTVMEMAGRAGYTTGMVAGKSKFSVLNKPGTIRHVALPEGINTSEDDATVAAETVKLIEAHQPGLLFVHFPEVDAAGHAKGWGSPEQLETIAHLDTQLAKVLAALDRSGLRQSTAIILTADHGGAGKTHGADDPRSRHIPWVITGPGVRPGYDLTQVPELIVNTEDTCATACYLLGLSQLPYFDGKPVLAAFVNPPAP